MGEATCGIAIELLLVSVRSHSASLSSVRISFFECRFREPIKASLRSYIPNSFVSFYPYCAHLKEELVKKVQANHSFYITFIALSRNIFQAKNANMFASRQGWYFPYTARGRRIPTPIEVVDLAILQIRMGCAYLC